MTHDRTLGGVRRTSESGTGVKHHVAKEGIGMPNIGAPHPPDHVWKLHSYEKQELLHYKNWKEELLQSSSPLLISMRTSIIDHWGLVNTNHVGCLTSDYRVPMPHLCYLKMDVNN